MGAGVGSGAGLLVSLADVMRWASVPALAYPVKSHHWHDRFSVPFSLALAGMSWLQQTHLSVPTWVRCLVAIGSPFHLVNQVVK